jgi:hypothetical protein
MRACDLADELRSSLRAADWTDGDRLRLVRQFVMDLEAWPPADVDALLFDEPMSVGDSRYDALIAGVVEDWAFHHGRAVPPWTADPSRFLDEWWFVTSVPALRPTAMVETPAALANRGVFIRRASLVNT